MVAQREVAGPNWKIAYDGYLDLYHLPILHKNTFGADFPNRALYHAFGPHQRVDAPNPLLLELEPQPEDDVADERAARRRLDDLPARLDRDLRRRRARRAASPSSSRATGRAIRSPSRRT